MSTRSWFAKWPARTTKRSLTHAAASKIARRLFLGIGPSAQTSPRAEATASAAHWRHAEMLPRVSSQPSPFNQVTRPTTDKYITWTRAGISAHTKKWSERPIFRGTTCAARSSLSSIKITSTMVPEAWAGQSELQSTKPLATIAASMFRSATDCLQCAHGQPEQCDTTCLK